MQLRSLLTGIFLLITACASTGRYDMKKIETDLSATVQKTEAIVQKSQADYREKTALIEGLKKTGTPDFKETEPGLRRHLGLMNLSLDKMNSRFKTMREASGRLVALGYSRPEIRGDDPQYPKVGEALSDFEHAAKDVNAAVLDYSRESNTLADEVTNKKLFFNFDVAEFQKRVQKAIRAAQEQTVSMQRDLDRAQGVILNWNRAESKTGHEAILQEMSDLGQKYTAKAQELSQISKDMNDAVSGQGRISTLDPQWPEAKKASDSFDAAVVEMKQVSDKFQEQNERFRKPVSQVR